MKFFFEKYAERIQIGEMNLNGWNRNFFIFQRDSFSQNIGVNDLTFFSNNFNL
jgi:hypothetical protein